MSKKNNISLTSKQIEDEIKRVNYKKSYINILKSTTISLVVIAAVALIIATFIFPVLQVSGNSMKPLFKEGDIIVTLKTNKIDTGDVIAFYHGNKILIKRVIATEGSWVTIGEEGEVYIDGTLLNEEYVSNKNLGESNIEYPYQVTGSQLFVLSDDRENTIDSRNSEIGTISSENIIGKLLFKVWPLK